MPSSVSGVRASVNLTLWRAAPTLLIAVISLVGAADVLRLPVISAPLRVGLVAVVLAVGVGLTNVLDRPLARPYWQIALASTLILMPVVSLQASAARAPFVALARGSAGPLLWLTFASCLTLVGLWLLAIAQSSDTPENASLLFLPAALLVPALLGAPGMLNETAALTMLGEAAMVGGVVILLGLLSPPTWRPAVGVIALGAQFPLLWSIGRAPVVGDQNGLVVPVSAMFLLALTVLLIVIAPLGALFSRRFVQTVEEESGVATVARAPEKGARWQSFR
jgi:hypothetical protein